jgi:translation initiation factor IF-1
MEFDTSASGSFDVEVGALHAHVSEISIRMTIPFLRHRRRPPLVGSIGGFQFGLKPFHIETKGLAVQVKGIVKGLAGEVDAKVECKTDMDVEGHVHGKLGRIQIDLEEEPKV